MGMLWFFCFFPLISAQLPLARFYNDDSYFFVPENRSVSGTTFVAHAVHFGRFDTKYNYFGIDFEPRKALITIDDEKVVQKCQYPGSTEDNCIPFEELYPFTFNVTDELFKLSWNHGIEGIPDCFTVSRYPRTKMFGAPRRDDLRMVSCGLYRISNMFFVDRVDAQDLSFDSCSSSMRNGSVPIYSILGGVPECRKPNFSSKWIFVISGLCFVLLTAVLTMVIRNIYVQKKVEPVVV